MLQGFSVTLGGSRRAGIYLSIHSGWYAEVAGQDEPCPGDTQRALAEWASYLSGPCCRLEATMRLEVAWWPVGKG